MAGLGALLCTFGARVAEAQTAAAQVGEFSVQRFEPAPGSKNFLSVETARMSGAWGWTVGLAFNYARNPFVVVSCASATNCADPSAQQRSNIPVVSDLFTWDVLASVSPAKFVQIGLRLPMAYAAGSGINADTGTPAASGLRAFGMGDMGLEGKFRVFGGPESPIVIGLAGDLIFPTGHATAPGAYLGNDSPLTGGVRGIVDGKFGRVTFAGNLRGVFRKDGRLASTSVGPVDFRYGAAVGYEVSPIFRLFAEGFGSTQFQATRGTNTLEIGGAVEFNLLQTPLFFRLGGSAGVLQGVGVPAGRVLAMITFAREAGDRDADGLTDDKDECPDLPEDKDGFEDSDGCPDDDNDGDKLVDSADKCPNDPETLNGLQDEDGCPDELPDRDKDGITDADDKCPDAAGKMRTKANYGCPDRDEDGITDAADKCPEKAEDTDGFEDTDGCPDPDNDGDGIPDDGDECIDQPEIMNGFKDEDGCPDEVPDRDKDGIPDARDKCPAAPETFNGFEDEDGCPDRGKTLVQVTDTAIRILERVEFATSKDKIDGKQSFVVLDAVIGALKAHPEIFLMEVAGHTDAMGSAADNRALSQKRAEAVVAYMVTKGIAATRLQARGYGPDKPVADNKTNVGKQRNRRVEFTILKSAKQAPREIDLDQPAPPAR